jgi:hypothetical protein
VCVSADSRLVSWNVASERERAEDDLGEVDQESPGVPAGKRAFKDKAPPPVFELVEDSVELDLAAVELLVELAAASLELLEAALVLVDASEVTLAFVLTAALELDAVALATKTWPEEEAEAVELEGTLHDFERRTRFVGGATTSGVVARALG